MKSQSLLKFNIDNECFFSSRKSILLVSTCFRLNDFKSKLFMFIFFLAYNNVVEFRETICQRQMVHHTSSDSFTSTENVTIYNILCMNVKKFHINNI